MLGMTTCVVMNLLQVTGVAWRLEAVCHPPPTSLVYTITLTSSSSPTTFLCSPAELQDLLSTLRTALHRSQRPFVV